LAQIIERHKDRGIEASLFANERVQKVLSGRVQKTNERKAVDHILDRRQHA